MRSMSSTSLFFISVTLLVLILTVESIYNVYSYDNGNDNEEHCCLVRIHDNFCLATPITRSLIQVNKHCHRFDKSKHCRYDIKKRNNIYSKQILHRLNVQATHEIDDKIFFELQTPLTKNILENDLICLTSSNNNSINLNKCFIQLFNDMNDDDYISHRQNSQQHHHNSDHKKRIPIDKDEEEDNAIDDDTNTEESQAEKETHRIELNQPIHVHEGHGLSIRQTYKINPKHIHPIDRQQRQCWSWYRRQTRKIRRDPLKYDKSCIQLTDHNEKCIAQLIYNTFNNNQINEQVKYTTVSIPIGSKLYCENPHHLHKLLGLYKYGKICFYTNDQIFIEHKFTDIAGLSDSRKNEDTLQFIANNTKLLSEFENDCHDNNNIN